MHYHNRNGINRTYSTSVPTSNTQFNSDSSSAKLLAKDYNLDHTDIHFTPSLYLEHLEEAAAAMELPTTNPSNPMYFYTNKVMRKNGIIVTYSGDGGDEIYSGYVSHGRYRRAESELKVNPIELHFDSIAWKLKKQMQMKRQDMHLNKKYFRLYMDSWFPKSEFGPDYLNNCLFVLSLIHI